MCHQFLCESCATVSWDFCSEASDFQLCPFFSQTTYKTDRRCKSCDVISGTIDELGFWLARHPHRGANCADPAPEDDDSISENSFTESDEEDKDENENTDGKESKVPKNVESPWGDQSQITIAEEENKKRVDDVEGKTYDEEDIGDVTIDMEESNGWMGL